MSVTNVYHKTRDRIYKMNFSASGETSWSFTAEADGDIYAVESNNVASYTINGASVSLPFSLTSGNSYAIAVTKTNAEQVADITFKSRRAIEKITSQNVPNFAKSVGDYVFVLFHSPNEIKKLDASLLKPSNYSGAGSWIVDPVVETIPLPAIPYGGAYSTMTFVESENPYFILYAWSDYDNYRYYSILDINTSVLYDLDKQNINGQTLISGGSNVGSNRLTIGNVYDYINNIIYYFDFSTILDGCRTFLDERINNRGEIIPNNNRAMPQYTFMPTSELVGGLTDFSLKDKRTYNFKENVSGWGFILSRGRTYTVNSTGALSEYDSFGVKTAGLGYVGTNRPSGYSQGSGAFISSNYLDTLAGTRTSGNQFFVHNLSDPAKRVWKAIEGGHLATGQTSLRSNIACSNAQELFFVFGNNGDGTKRMYIIDPLQTPMDFGYIDFINDIGVIFTNQMLI